MNFANSFVKSYGDKTFVIDSKRVFEIKENEGSFYLQLLNTPFVNNQSPLVNFKYTPQGNLIIDTYQQGVHQSFDNGVSWENIGLPSSIITDNSQLNAFDDYDNIPFLVIKEDNIMNLEPGIYFYIQNVLSLEENVMANRINIYPNPVQTELFFQSDKDVDSVMVFDYSGKKIFSIKQNNLEKINVSEFNQGLYIILIEDSEGNQNWSKFIKK